MLAHSVALAREAVTYHLACWQHRLAPRPADAASLILVNGSPKSGTTWMVKLLASLPGYRAVGNFQGVLERYRSAPPRSVVHGHDPFDAEMAALRRELPSMRVVLMLRDPRDQLVSRVYHIRRDPGHVWHEAFQQMSDEEAMVACIEGRDGLPSAATMVALPQGWLESGTPLVALRYEALLAEPERELGRVLAHVGVVASPRLIRTIVARNRFERLSAGRRFWQSGRPRGSEDPSSHYRKGIAGDWRNHFTPDVVRRFKAALGPTLVEMGYERDLEW